MVDQPRGEPATTAQRIGLIFGPVLAVLVYWFAPDVQLNDAGDVIAGLTREGRAAAAVAVLMATWWMTEAIPISATALLPVGLFPLLGVTSITSAASPYASPVIALFLGGFVLGLSMQRWGLHKRIALLTIVLFGTRPRAIIAGFMAAAAILSMWVSNTATAAMMLPIGISVIHLVYSRLEGDFNPDLAGRGAPVGANFGVCIVLGIAYACSIGGVGTLIGTPPNMVLKGFLERTYGERIDFVRWMYLGVPLVLIMLPLTWGVLTYFVFPLKLREIPGGGDVIRRELRALGPMSAGEWAVFLVFCCTAVAWITRPLLVDWFGLRAAFGGREVELLTDEGIAIVAALLLFIIRVPLSRDAMLGEQPAKRRWAPVMNWQTAETIPWGVLILFGGGLSLAAAIQSTGVDAFLGRQFTLLAGLPTFLVVLGVAGAVVFLTEVTSNTAVATTLMPVLAAAGVGMGIPPEMLLVPAAIAASLAFMLPVGTPPNAMAFGTAYVKMPQMIRAGFVLNLVSIIVITIVCYWLTGPMLGLRLGK